jgi:hypothetical protein
MRIASLLLCCMLADVTRTPTAAFADTILPPVVVAVTAGGKVEVSLDGQRSTLNEGGRIGSWTLMGVTEAADGKFAIFEDLRKEGGRMVFADKSGVVAELPKSLEPTFPLEPSKLCYGHTLKEVFDSPADLLGEETLAKAGDPQYEDVAACFPPLLRGTETFTFVGTQENSDKVGFNSGGRTSHFDPAVYVPAIRKIRDSGKVWHGLVGGWLPVLRFVYPEEDAGTWSELLAFAPPRMDDGNSWIQPVWYRVSRVENDELRWVRYFDSYHPFPPRGEGTAAEFYRDLQATRVYWMQALEPAMQIDIPDERLKNLALHSLVRDMMTRDGARPKYGVVDKNYAGNEHEGFQDTFNADTAAMTDWGLFRLARLYINNYYDRYVREDGSLLYRGPETGQYGRMLTVTAQYARASGDYETLLRHERKLESIVRLLRELRRHSLERSKDDPARGIPAGWSEADACLDEEPNRYMQPYLSNAAEMVRGLQEMGEAWRAAGERNPERGDLRGRGAAMIEETAAVRRDLNGAIERSTFRNLRPPFLPAIAGVEEPFDVACLRDPSDPQFRSYRAFMELLHSGVLTKDQVKTIVAYRGAHHDIILGVPTAYGYNTHELAGFLTYGHAYGMIQHDLVREYLLTLYSVMAHQYARGVWTAPETRPLKAKVPAAAYCTPAQLVAPMMLRWMLVLEDPAADKLWLAKGTPRSWLIDGRHIAVNDAPTRWGNVAFAIRSRLAQNRVEAEVILPSSGMAVPTVLRLRAPEGFAMQSVRVDGREWRDFSAGEEIVTLPAGAKGTSTIEATYHRSAN